MFYLLVYYLLTLYHMDGMVVFDARDYSSDREGNACRVANLKVHHEEYTTIDVAKQRISSINILLLG